MLVTFSCKSYADITMFGEVAISLLKMMGHSGSVPGALSADEVPAALQRLSNGLAEEEQQNGGTEQSEEESPVSLAQRALPLIALLQTAQGAHTHVMWDKE